MIPWTGLLLSSFLFLSATTSHAARRLTEPSLPADADLAAIAGSLGAESVPPGTNLTALAESVPDETKAEYLSSMGNGTSPPDLSAIAGSIPNLPPGTNLTALAESVPDETKAEYLSSMGNGASPADLSALLAGATALQPMNIDIPDMPNVEIPDFSLPPIPQPTVSVFGHEFRLPLGDLLGAGAGAGH